MSQKLNKKAAEQVEQKLYKLRGVSETRFASYFEGSISNFDKNNNSCYKKKDRQFT